MNSHSNIQLLPLKKQTNRPRGRKREFKTSLQRRFRYYRKRLLNLHGSPSVIARGIAAGVFAGMFPILGFQTIVGVLLAILLRGNKLAAMAATWISNPLTYVPLFIFNFQVGQWFLGRSDVALDEINWESTAEILQLGYLFVFTLLIGCLVVGLMTSVIAYFVSLRLLIRFRSRQEYRRRQHEKKDW